MGSSYSNVFQADTLHVFAGGVAQDQMPQRERQPFVFQANLSFLGAHPCPVCGFGMDQPPDDFNICPSCGVEFGYSDSGSSYEALRSEWLRHGAAWASKVRLRPFGWNAYSQLLLAGFTSLPIVWNDSNTLVSKRKLIATGDAADHTNPSAVVFDYA